MTKEQLLILRVMCVGGEEKGLTDTSGEFVNGDILTEGKFVRLSGEWHMLTKIILEKICEDFPHLFQPMKWWEGRQPEDMPLYLKAKKTGAVRKVLSYTRNPEGAADFAGEDFPTALEWFEPATEQEYNEYQNSLRV